MGLLADEVLVSPATSDQTRRAGPTVDGRPSNAQLGHHGDSGGNAVAVEDVESHAGVRDQGDGCAAERSVRRRSSGGGIWHAESVPPKPPFLTNPSRTPPAGRPRSAGLKTQTDTLHPHTGLRGVLRGRWHEARRWASWESDGGDSARKGWFDGTLRVT
jgi:hypothetical protein